ncbi:hypothetical protein AVEN_65378-1 [Araneus ventricosus]|uniref:Uncharacterized protein n=1 Tax=Araneus ventricosus TaxID=182803 RepID=A0A4Y2I1S5_ARAVE|nr:hypothetical protein AVEN_65378-1 [Araneus ventricosus]
MYRVSLKVLFSLFIWTIVLTTSHSSEVAENLTETDSDDAEFRQGGIAQQLMSSYPAMSMGNIYGGNTGGYQMMGAGSGATGGGYVNMLRNLYRPSSFGLTDKVKHWVKSFMNRRQYVKPYYNPTGGLSYAAGEYGAKPMFGGANGYKAISVPLRQLQKYYKPYYANSEAGSPQYLQSAGGSSPGAAGASSFMSYSPSAGGVSSSGGLYASESANAGHFTGGTSGMYGSSADGASALYGAGGPASSGIFSSGNSPSGGLFSSGNAGSSGLFSSQGGSGGLFSGSDGSSSGLYTGAGLSSGGLYGSSGSPSSGLFHGSSGGANGPVFSLDGSSSSGIYGSEGSSSYFGGNGGAEGYGSSAAASSLLASLNGGSSGGSYGDLYASGASPSAAVYSPSSGNGRNYGNSNNKQPSYGASSSALYMSSDDRSSESYPSSKSSKEHNSFNVDSSRNTETSYSVSFQPAQGKSYSAAYESAGFQPVAYSPDSGNAQGFQEKSS